MYPIITKRGPIISINPVYFFTIFILRKILKK